MLFPGAIFIAFNIYKDSQTYYDQSFKIKLKNERDFTNKQIIPNRILYF